MKAMYSSFSLIFYPKGKSRLRRIHEIYGLGRIVMTRSSGTRL
jgi:hypothetical protein